MNSPRGSARMPTRLDRQRSISPHLLDSYIDASVAQSPTSRAAASYRLSRKPVSTPALPSKVILSILWSADANTFASLCLVSRQWWQTAQKVDLYAYHLSRCPSYALSNPVISGPFRRNDLSRLRSKFAAEIRRNLFEAYLRPRKTFINLISLHASSSAAFPAGEAFRFEFSPNARTILALSSSRIYVLDATADPPTVKRQLKTVRRPLSASVTDDGSLLAVLSSKHQVNIYGLTPQGVQHLQVIAMDHQPKMVAIAHEGTVLAASYATGIEVFSLASNCLTTDRRAVRSEAVDTLNFSGDGSMLVGSSLSLEEPNAVVISAPFYTENDPEMSPREIHSRMWTTQILFPQISSVCSHMTPLPGHIEGDASWLFAFDHSLMSYRAVRTDDTRAGVAYFLSPPGADRFDTPIPTISPSASACGTLALAAFEGSELYLYGVPERLDLSPDMGAVVEQQNDHRRDGTLPLTSATGNMESLLAYSPSTSASDYPIDEDGLAGKVDWRQSLFVKCRGVQGLSGQNSARWVELGDGSSTPMRKRVIIVAPGGVTLDRDELGDEGMPVDGSRMCLLDFDYTPSVAPDRVLTIEVGDAEAELLTEQTGSMATEVAMERRRTIRAIPSSENSRAALGRSVTSISPPSIPFLEEERRGTSSSPSSPIEQSQVYAASGLHRSATASGFRHARYPPRPPLGSVPHPDQNQGHYRTNHLGRPISEDSWETPPPPYQGANNPGYGAHTSFGGRPPTRERTQSHPDGSANVHSTQAQFRAYRAVAAERAATLETVMTSHAAPSGVHMSQHDELLMAARSRGPSEASLDAVNEPSWNVPGTPEIAASNMSSTLSRPNIDGSSRTRPVTHHGTIQYGWQGPNRSATMPISPTWSGSLNGVVEEHIEISPTSATNPNRVSLTGANLQNRLNHPVPPVPEIPRSLVPGGPNVGPVAEPRDRRSIQLYEQIVVHGNMPIQDQTMSVNRRISQRETQRPPAVKNTSFVHRPVPGTAPSPPRSAWGAAEISGSLAPYQAHRMPNGVSISRSNSRGSYTSNLASASAPNLLEQLSRYGRTDTTGNVQDPSTISGNNAGMRSRAHSLTQPVVMTGMEPSAYHETSRSGPTAKHGKKAKKKREEVIKRSSRCDVM